MLFTLQDDGVLRVYVDVQAAVNAVEGLAAETTFREVFDDNAQPYGIEWLDPSQHERAAAGNGHYTLSARGEPDARGMLRMIDAARAIEPAALTSFVRGLEVQLGDVVERERTY